MNERRQDERKLNVNAMKKELNDSQLATLNSLETFGWELKFVRQPLFQDAVPIVFDGSREHFAILEADGTLNEDPDVTVRD